MKPGRFKRCLGSERPTLVNSECRNSRNFAVERSMENISAVEPEDVGAPKHEVTSTWRVDTVLLFHPRTGPRQCYLDRSDAGRVKEKRLSPSSAVLTPISPPWSSTI